MSLGNVQIISAFMHICRVNKSITVYVPRNFEKKQGSSNKNVKLYLLQLWITCSAPKTQRNAGSQQIKEVEDEVDAQPARKFSDAVDNPGIPKDRYDEYNIHGEDQIDATPQYE